MSEKSAFLAAIIAEPEDDTRRLAYADYLEEHDEAKRAAMIRHQIAFRGGSAGWTAEVLVGELTDAERELLSRLPLGGLVFRRGFLESVTCTAADWLAHADAVHWHPSQTVACPECKGGKGIGHFSGIDYGPCPTCSREGIISRPCPPTAHPVREVTLTTFPETYQSKESGDPIVGRWLHRLTDGTRWFTRWEIDEATERAPRNELFPRSTYIGLFHLTWSGVAFTFDVPEEDGPTWAREVLRPAGTGNGLTQSQEALHRVNSHPFYGFAPGTVQLRDVRGQLVPGGSWRVSYVFGPPGVPVVGAYDEFDFNTLFAPPAVEVLA